MRLVTDMTGRLLSVHCNPSASPHATPVHGMILEFSRLQLSDFLIYPLQSQWDNFGIRSILIIIGIWFKWFGIQILPWPFTIDHLKKPHFCSNVIHDNSIWYSIHTNTTPSQKWHTTQMYVCYTTVHHEWSTLEPVLVHDSAAARRCVSH